jgi:hypothetical protein
MSVSLKKKVAIYTCIYGGYESTLRNFAEMQTQTVLQLDFFCFTDNQSVISGGKNWKIIQFEPCKEFCTCSASHYETLGKMHNVALIRSRPDQIDCMKKYDACIYVDGNCIVNDVHFFEDMVKNKFGNPKLIISKHPDRNCIYKEAQVSMQMPKYSNTDLQKQINGYFLQNYPEENGLFWNGLMVYVDHTSQKFKSFYDFWSKELLDYVISDKMGYHGQGQVSLPFVLWKLGYFEAADDLPHLEILENMYSHNVSNPIYIVEHGQ